jgi:anti-anti-sigma factor
MPSSPSEFPLQIVEEGDCVTIRFPSGTGLGEANCAAFSREVFAAAEGRGHVVLDLAGITWLTSVILAKIMELNNKLRDAGGRLTLTNPSVIVRQVFKVTRLDTVLEVTDAVPT